MSPDVPPSSTAIGATLRDARRRLGLEVREVEERTKIRARYIRALENEDWETLPAPAYIRGFLRTYGQLLGLDGEMLADEFRRRYGDGQGTTSGSPEPVLTERRRHSIGRSPSPAMWIVGVIVGIVVLLLVLHWVGGGGDQSPSGSGNHAAKGKKAGKKGKHGKGKGGGKHGGSGKLEPTRAVVAAKTDTEVCLVAGSTQALIDSQTLQAGAREVYTGHKRYRLDVGPGKLKFIVGDNAERIDSGKPSGYEADSQGITPGEYQGPDCP